VASRPRGAVGAGVCYAVARSGSCDVRLPFRRDTVSSASAVYERLKIIGACRSFGCTPSIKIGFCFAFKQGSTTYKNFGILIFASKQGH